MCSQTHTCTRTGSWKLLKKKKKPVLFKLCVPLPDGFFLVRVTWLTNGKLYCFNDPHLWVIGASECPHTHTHTHVPYNVSVSLLHFFTLPVSLIYHTSTCNGRKGSHCRPDTLGAWADGLKGYTISRCWVILWVLQSMVNSSVLHSRFFFPPSFHCVASSIFCCWPDFVHLWKLLLSLCWSLLSLSFFVFPFLSPRFLSPLMPFTLRVRGWPQMATRNRSRTRLRSLQEWLSSHRHRYSTKIF